MRQGDAASERSGHVWRWPLSTPAAPTGQQVGAHFNVVSAIPMTVFVGVVTALLATGAPAHTPSLAHARHAVGELTVVNLGLLVLVGLALGLLTHPLQRALVQALEGYWPAVGWVGL